MDTKSRQKIIQELISKGIDKETAESAWEEEAALNMPDERKILYRTVEKKYSPDTELDEKEIDSWIRLTRVLTHEIMNSVTPITSLCDTLLSISADKDDGKRVACLCRIIPAIHTHTDTGTLLVLCESIHRKNG